MTNYKSNIIKVLNDAGYSIANGEDYAEILEAVLTEVDHFYAGGIREAVTSGRILRTFTPSLNTPLNGFTRGGARVPVILPPEGGISFGEEADRVRGPYKVCECGGEKTKMPHLSWCPMFREDK